MKQEHIDSDFDDFLKQDGLLAECGTGALKRVIACQIEREMKVISRAKLASCLKTSRATLDRLLSQNEASVTFQLLEQAALAVLGELRHREGFFGDHTGCYTLPEAYPVFHAASKG